MERFSQRVDFYFVAVVDELTSRLSIQLNLRGTEDSCRAASSGYPLRPEASSGQVDAPSGITEMMPTW